MKHKFFSGSQMLWLVILRVAIGWHFLFEGLAKLSDPDWSSYLYLMDSKGFLEGFFKMLAGNEQTLHIVDLMNIWGLIIIGLFLMLGLFTKQVTMAAILLLSLYYLSHPPFFNLDYALPDAGSHWIVDKMLIEILALVILLVFPTGKEVGLDRLIYSKKRK
jgi:thiosulfate dehydrogenase [quinone] large subunit